MFFRTLMFAAPIVLSSYYQGRIVSKTSYTPILSVSNDESTEVAIFERKPVRTAARASGRVVVKGVVVAGKGVGKVLGVQRRVERRQNRRGE